MLAITVIFNNLANAVNKHAHCNAINERKPWTLSYKMYFIDKVSQIAFIHTYKLHLSLPIHLEHGYTVEIQ